MEPIVCDHDNFVFKKKVNINKHNTTTNRNKSRFNKQQQQQKRSSQIINEHTILIDTSDLPCILDRYTICIHKDLDVGKFQTIAEGLGATVKTEMTKSVTHLIIEPKGNIRQLKMVNQAVSKGIVCTSPKWLMACYVERKYCPPTAYQYDIDESIHTLENPTSQTVYNPFNTSFIDYDELEKNKPLEGGQLRMDEFLSKPSRSRESTVNEIDEQDVAEEEFFYNSTSSSSVQELTEEELEAKRLKSQERSLQIQKAVEERRALLRQSVKTESIPKKKRVISNVYGERLKVWYGEQQFSNEDKLKRSKR